MRYAEIYREHAANALKSAKKMAGEENRKCLLALANNWIKAAERLDQKASAPGSLDQLARQ
jgi:hypothetical protein